MNIRTFNLFASSSINKLNGLRTIISFRSWGIWNIFHRNIFTRLTWNRIYRITGFTIFRVISWYYWNFTWCCSCWVIRVGWKLRLWSIRNWLTIRANRNYMTIWCISYHNCLIQVIRSNCSPTSNRLICMIARYYWSINVAKCMTRNIPTSFTNNFTSYLINCSALSESEMLNIIRWCLIASTFIMNCLSTGCF